MELAVERISLQIRGAVTVKSGHEKPQERYIRKKGNRYGNGGRQLYERISLALSRFGRSQGTERNSGCKGTAEGRKSIWSSVRSTEVSGMYRKRSSVMYSKIDRRHVPCPREEHPCALVVTQAGLSTEQCTRTGRGPYHSRAREQCSDHAGTV